MASSDAAGPSLSAIGTAQNDESNLRRQLAARRLYTDAKIFHFSGRTVSVLLALAAPFFVWLWPGAGPVLGAMAGAWIFVSRLVLIPLRDKKQFQGAVAQEMFDSQVLGIDWNSGLAEPLAQEDIHGAAKRAKDRAAGDWYPTDSDAPWPRSVLICQRSNAVWARRQHAGYGWFLVGGAAAWGTAGIVVGLAVGTTLATYLTTVALPSLPALLDASEEARAHFRHSKSRQRIESSITQELSKSSSDASTLRSIQDQIFLLRRQAPLVPEWFYKVRRARLEADMRGAASEIAEGDIGDESG